MKITLREALKAGPVNVTFTKADGSKRNMRATTKADLITYTYASKDVAPEPAGIVRVWDLDINEWRSIREDRLISFG